MESITDHTGIESKSEMKEGRFSRTSFNYASVLFRIKRTLAGKDITISIALAKRNNYMSPKFAN